MSKKLLLGVVLLAVVIVAIAYFLNLLKEKRG